MTNTNNPAPCATCDGSGTVHRADGEYMGECPCGGDAPPAPVVAADEQRSDMASYLGAFSATRNGVPVDVTVTKVEDSTLSLKLGEPRLQTATAAYVSPTGNALLDALRADEANRLARAASPAAAPEAAHADNRLEMLIHEITGYEGEDDAYSYLRRALSELMEYRRADDVAHAQQDAAPAEPVLYARRSDLSNLALHRSASRDAAVVTSYVQDGDFAVPLFAAAVAPSDATGKADAANAGGLSAVDEEAERTSAMDRAFPITGNPHTSVQQRTMQNRVAFGFGWDARAALSKHDWQQGYADALDLHELKGDRASATSAADAKDAERIKDLERQLSECLAVTAKWSAAAGAASQDAERYRWLRNHDIMQHVGSFAPYVVQGQTMRMLEGKEVDAAVDAAIAAQQAASVAKGEQVTVACKYEVYPAGTSPRICARCGKGPCTQRAQSSAKGGDAVGGA